jgi:hypothetical protein
VVRALLVLCCVALVAVACTRTPAPNPVASGPAAYYLSPAGDDAAAGTSPEAAWRSLGRASRAVLRPGTRLLLQGGQRFTGQLTLDRADAGDAGRPVVIGSYGRGPATISSGGTAIYIHDTAGVEVSDLDLAGRRGAAQGGAVGLNVYNDLGRRLGHVVVTGVRATGFADGIVIGGKNDGAGFGQVRVGHCVLDGNVDAGLLTYGPAFRAAAPAYANQDVTVSHVVASGNTGRPRGGQKPTGNGIVLGSVRDGLVTWSTASGNGGSSTAVHGPAGIWAYDSTGVTIEHSAAYRNRTGNRVDGNGFGLDQNTSHSVLQFDRSYGNDGAGFLVYSALGNGAQKDNVVRYNISSGDVRDANVFYGGITVIGRLARTDVYQNTVVMAGGPGPALRLGPSVRAVSVRNNILAAGSGSIVAAVRALPAAAAVLQGNDYFSAAGPWAVTWGTAVYGSLPAWRAASAQETVSGRTSGFAVDPRLTARFALPPGSPLLGAGLDLAVFGLEPGPVNYAGRMVSARHPDVGAQ